jgi:hypothetical protein
MMMSGRSLTNSCASARIRLVSRPPHRKSIRTLRPSVQPKSANAWVNAEMRAFNTGLFSSVVLNTPMRRMRSPCCARAASGHAVAPPRDEFAPTHPSPLRLRLASLSRLGLHVWPVSVHSFEKIAIFRAFSHGDPNRVRPIGWKAIPVSRRTRPASRRASIPGGSRKTICLPLRHYLSNWGALFLYRKWRVQGCSVSRTIIWPTPAGRSKAAGT